MIKEKITISAQEHGHRIDTICAQKIKSISRSQWASRGIFKCNGQEKPGKTKTKQNENWEISYEEKTSFNEISPWSYPLKVLKETNNWIAIEKPTGIAVHPSASDPTQTTMLNALVAKFGTNLSEQIDIIDGQKIPRPGLVHRLDKETSGILLVAKNNTTHHFLQSHWSNVEKTYTALVTGKPPHKGKIEAGITRDPSRRKKMTVSGAEKAKDALTFFERIQYNDQKNISLLKIKIPTGRTHQIRVHLNAIGFPIVGDKKYGGEKAERLMLHATSICFPDPNKKEKRIEISSKIPKEFDIETHKKV